MPLPLKRRYKSKIGDCIASPAIENDKQMAKAIKAGIEAGNEYQVTLSHDGTEGLKKAETGEFDSAVIDGDLPKKDGFTVLRDLRKNGNHVLTLLYSEPTCATFPIRVLDVDADVYLQKSGNLDELQVWIRSLLRKRYQNMGAMIRYADLRVDPVNHKVWRNDKEIVMTAKEYRLLLYFAKNAGKVLTRQNIADNCWTESLDSFSNIIDVYINHLRKKVNNEFLTKLIHTVRGQGYILEERG